MDRAARVADVTDSKLQHMLHVRVTQSHGQTLILFFLKLRLGIDSHICLVQGHEMQASSSTMTGGKTMRSSRYEARPSRCGGNSQ